jgi:hypothetical protein
MEQVSADKRAGDACYESDGRCLIWDEKGCKGRCNNWRQQTWKDNSDSRCGHDARLKSEWRETHYQPPSVRRVNARPGFC